MRFREGVGGSVGHEVEREEAGGGGAGGALQGAEAREGHASGAGDELKQPGAHLGVELLDDFPEPVDDGRVGVDVLEAGVAAPVCGVEVGAAGEKGLQVAGGEGAQELRGDDVSQAALQREPLPLGAAREAVRDVQPHVVALVVVRDGLVGASRPQLHAPHCAERRTLHGECRVYYSGDTVVSEISKI